MQNRNSPYRFVDHEGRQMFKGAAIGLPDNAPGIVRCDPCDGVGVLMDSWEPCKDCFMTGLTPIPGSEFYGRDYKQPL